MRHADPGGGGASKRSSVVVTDIDIGFRRVVGPMVEWVLARIPSLAIVAAVGFAVGIIDVRILQGLARR